jgi:hypothetical protein
MLPHNVYYHWEPLDALKITNLGFCVGKNVNGKQCTKPIRKTLQSEAERLIVGIGAEKPDAVALRAELSELAELSLCSWHTDQKKGIVKLWQAHVKNFAADEAGRRRQRLQRRQRRQRRLEDETRQKKVADVVAMLSHLSID